MLVRCVGVCNCVRALLCFGRMCLIECVFYGVRGFLCNRVKGFVCDGVKGFVCER